MVKPGFRFHSVLSTPGTSAGIAGVTDGGGGVRKQRDDDDNDDKPDDDDWG